MEEKVSTKLINKMVKPLYPDIEWFDIIYDTRSGLCEIDYDIITSLEKFFNMKREKINIFHYTL